MYRLFFLLILVCSFGFGQSISQKLDSAVKELLDSPQAYSSNLSVYVTDEKGKLVYDYQGNKGLSTASTQKIFSAGAALELLGSEYKYTTTIAHSGVILDSKLKGNLIIHSNGDPTLGSWRYEGYKPEDFKKKVLEILKKADIQEISGDFVLDDSYFDFQTIPGGWPWDDLGNYYGAGVWGINWRENQFDLLMKGSQIQKTTTELPNVSWISEVKAEGNSDQSLIFTAPHSDVALINGSLPADKISTVSGATPNPPLTLGNELKNLLKENGIKFNGDVYSVSMKKLEGKSVTTLSEGEILGSYQSPSLDKIVYWFMRKSVNLYGETFVKTLAKTKSKDSSFKAGISYLKEFWKSKGLHPSTINFADGSGLSPQNYVSAKAEVQALLYAKKQPWFIAFFEGFPTQKNGMKMKSGSMRNTKSYAGFHNGYAFSIIINNYQGSNSSEALYKVLNILK